MRDLTLQEIESEVRRHFYVYETKVFPEYIEFHVVFLRIRKGYNRNSGNYGKPSKKRDMFLHYPERKVSM